jgi:hypothetical protein
MHRVPYGEWLETANDRKYAVLEPTIRSLEGAFMDAARDALK